MTIDDAAKLLQRFQQADWALDRRITKKAQKEQKQAANLIVSQMCQRILTKDELDYVMRFLN